MSNQAEIDYRVTQIQDMLLMGHTRGRILQFASEWDVSERQVDEYLRRAYEALKEFNKATVNENRAVVLGQLWESVRRSRAAMDERLVQSGLAQISKITGLEKTTLIVDDKRDLEDLTDEELAQMWAEANESDDDDEEYDS